MGFGKVPQKFEVLRRILMINWCCLCRSRKVSLSCFTPLFVGRGDMLVVFSSKCFSPLFGGRGDMVVVFSSKLLIPYQCTISGFYIYKS